MGLKSFLKNFFSPCPRHEDKKFKEEIRKKLDDLLTNVDRLIYLQEKEMAIEKEEVKQLIQIVAGLIQTNVEDKSQIEALKAQAADLKSKTDWLNDPELDQELEAVINAASGSAPAPEVPTTPGEPVEPTPVEPPVTEGPAEVGAPFTPPSPEEVPTDEPAPEVPVADEPVGTEEMPAPAEEENK